MTSVNLYGLLDSYPVTKYVGAPAISFLYDLVSAVLGAALIITTRRFLAVRRKWNAVL